MVQVKSVWAYLPIGVRDWFTDSAFVGFGWGEREVQLEKVKTGCDRYLPQLEKLLSRSSPFVCGADPCYADFQVNMYNHLCVLITKYVVHS